MPGFFIVEITWAPCGYDGDAASDAHTCSDLIDGQSQPGVDLLTMWTNASHRDARKVLHAGAR